MNAGAQCFTDADLSRLLDSSDGIDPDPQTTTHIGQCPHCQSRLESLAGGTDWISTSSISTDREDGQPPRVDGYTIGSLIGSGGMGRVYRATDDTLGRDVAIKFLAPQIAASQSARERFLREARAAAALQHPNLVAIYHIGNAPDDALPYFVMEFVDGVSLTSKIGSTPLPVSEIIPVATQVALALEAAHAAGIIHRDIKPDNVLLTADTDTVKVTDFGLARTTADTAVTIAGQLPGTPDYMAPEQALGHPADKRSDLWSLGCLLYQMATANRPFIADTPIAVLRKIIDEPPPPLPASLPPPFTSLVHRLLEKDPQTRPQSATAVLKQLAKLDGTPQQDHQNRASPHFLAAAITISVAAAIIAFFFTRPNTPGSPAVTTPNPPAPAPVAPAQPVPDPDPEPNSRLTTAGTPAATPPTAHVVPADGSDPATHPHPQAALDASSPGDTVELDWDGPARLVKLDIKTPGLTLRPKPGRHPSLTFARARGPLIRVRSHLRVDGIGFHWTKPETTVSESKRRASTATSFPNNTLIVHEAGSLTLSHCRIAVEIPDQPDAFPSPDTPYDDIRPVFKRMAIQSAGTTDLALLSCELYAPGATAIDWLDNGESSIQIHRSLIVANTAAVVRSQGSKPCHLDLQDSTLLSNRTLHLVAGPTARELVLKSGTSAIQTVQLFAAGPRFKKVDPFITRELFRWITPAPTILELVTNSPSYLASLPESALPAGYTARIIDDLDPTLTLTPLRFQRRNWRQESSSLSTWQPSDFTAETPAGTPVGCPPEIGPAHAHQ